MSILGRQAAVRISKSETYLNYLQKINITFNSLVIIVWSIPERPYWTRNDTRELRILRFNCIRLEGKAIIPSQYTGNYQLCHESCPFPLQDCAPKPPWYGSQVHYVPRMSQMESSLCFLLLVDPFASTLFGILSNLAFRSRQGQLEKNWSDWSLILEVCIINGDSGLWRRAWVTSRMTSIMLISARDSA